MNNTINPSEWHKIMCSGDACYVLDVRTTPEYREVHLQKDTLHMPLGELDMTRLRAAFPNPSKPIYIVCKGGKRAATAAEQLRLAGFQNAVVVDGGLDACMTCGFDVVRANILSLERQVRMAAGAIIILGVLLGILLAPVFLVICAFVGIGLFISGLTGWCGMAMVLAKAPWNK